MKEYLEAAKITSTHALRGEVKAELWCDSAEFLSSFKKLYLDAAGKTALTVLSVRRHKNGAILKFDEIKDINEAESLRGKILYCKRADAPLEAGRHFLDDLVGCTVADIKSKEEYGVVTGVQNFGASDILEVKCRNKTCLIPLIDEIVKEISPENSFIGIVKMKGLFDED